MVCFIILPSMVNFKVRISHLSHLKSWQMNFPLPFLVSLRIPGPLPLQWFMRNYNYSSWCSNCLKFDQWELLQVGYWFLWNAPLDFNSFLNLWHNKMLDSFVHSLPPPPHHRSGISHFSKKFPFSEGWSLETSIWLLRIFIVPGLALLLSLYSKQS